MTSTTVKEAIEWIIGALSRGEEIRDSRYLADIITAAQEAETLRYQLEENAGHIGDLLDVNKENDQLRARIAELEKQQAVITVEDISRHIQTWRFDDSINGAFGAYLMNKYPNGLKIVGGG